MSVQELELDYWEERYNTLFPHGLTLEETDEANAEMWKCVYPTREMQEEVERESA